MRIHVQAPFGAPDGARAVEAEGVLETRLECGSLQSEWMIGRQSCAQCACGIVNCLVGAVPVVLGIACAGKYQLRFADGRTPMRVACQRGGELECLVTQLRGICDVSGS